MEIELIRSKRKTLALEIKKDGRVIVRAPLRATEKEIKRFVDAHRDWLVKHYQQVLERAEKNPEPTDEEIERLRTLAKMVLPERVEYWAKRMGVEPTGVKITSAKTRFGSCSSKNSICFSLYLMKYPQEAIDYVVVHELAHIRQHNHSPAFYAEIEKVLPDYRRREKMLRQK